MTTTTRLERPATEAVAAALAVVRANLRHFGPSYPGDTTVGGVYELRPAGAGQPAGANIGWTTGFCAGLVWLAWELTGDDEFRVAGDGHAASFTARIDQMADVETHDLGFLYSLAAVTPWRLTGCAESRRAAVAAASHLMTRFLEPAGIIQAWGDLTDPAERGRTIIDSLMNLPLLHWASETTGDRRYAAAARRHADQLRDHIIRPDGTTFHTFRWDPVSGRPLRGTTAQGWADDSCWARGQVWGVLGFAINYRHTGEPTYLAAARRLADRFLAHLPADGVPTWDLALADDPTALRDSSAAAIAVCGLDELARCLAPGEDGRERYVAARDRLLTSLSTAYAPAVGSRPGTPLLAHGVYDFPKGVGVDEGSLWGDYFYLEALRRVTDPAWPGYW
ncbi:MAG: glycoside hydrolase family 88 protein [Propionibacteriaceae bacterium]|jgi:unsaturated chondroitin disaccharide hydrolase|nr:glycoside hydrolase family 88 protein [Propionibacteriaceae bacterium]